MTGKSTHRRSSAPLRISQWASVAGLALVVMLKLAVPAVGQGAQAGGGAASGIQTPSLGMTGHADELIDLTTPQLGMTGHADELIDLTTPKLGMTGHADELIDLTTPKLGMTGHADELIDLTTPKLGMTGHADELIDLTTPKLGMTGHADELIDLTTAKLGMTGYADELIDLTTPKLGMTGYADELIDLTTLKLGMTGWRSAPDEAPPPAIVCLGGQIMRVATGPGATKDSCSCPAGRTARPVGSSYQNTFQCIPDAVVPPPQPKIVCIGGAVQGGRCICAAGKTPKLAQYAISGNAPAWRCEDSAPVRVADPPKIVCTGGSVRNNACVCQAGFVPVKTGTTSFRCQRVAVLPPPVVTPKPSVPTRVTTPQIACAGGVVRSNVCVCPGGTRLQNGVCRAAPTSVPLRSIAPQRVR